MVICFNSLRINTGLILPLFVVATILTAPVLTSEAFGQAAGPSRASAASAENHDQPYAPLGQSGYRVPLPEIKLNQILGEQSSKKKSKPPDADESAAPQRETAGPTGKGGPEQPDQEETSVAPEPPRLPFDHATLKRGPRAIPEKSAAEEHPPAPPLPKERVFPLAAPTAPEDLMVARPPKKEVIGKRIPPGAPPLLEAQPSKETLKTIPLKAQEAPPSGPVEGIPFGTRGEPEIVPVKEPEPKPPPAVSASPEPELSPAPKEKTPVTVESDLDKTTPKERTPVAPSPEPEPVTSSPKETTSVAPPSPQPKPDISTPKERTPVSLPEPKAVISGPKETTLVAPPSPELKPDILRPKEKTSSFPSIEPEPDEPAARETTPIVALPPVPEPEPEKSAPKEVAPSAPPVEPAHEESIPKESLPGFDRPVAPPKEVLRSPLDQETPDTPEIKHYLRDTAPILEELSLLMTRAPSINIADFDPSDADTPLFPRDLQLKMDSMKRDLQILDSKTFAIIPPKRYEQFHDLIRDSITQTHQACDAILTYIAEPNEENFKTIQEHLFRARELIQKTRSHG